jgi:peptide/nickel transport system permease protein
MKGRRLYLWLGLALILLIIGVALGAEHLTKVNPYYVESRISSLEAKAPFPPSAQHLLGTDSLGRDLWSRIAFGARWSLLFAVVVAFGRILIGLPMAWLAVFGPRPFKWLVERLYVLTNTVPPLLLYLVLLAAPAVRLIGLMPSIVLTVSLLTLWEWPRLAGTLKGRLEQLSHEGYVEGAIATGAGPWRLFRLHLLPPLMPLLLRLGVGEMGQVLLTVAHLGLFGVWLGGGSVELVDNGRGGELQILTTSIPEWGTLLSEARLWLRSAPWIPLAPAGAFFVAITGFNLVAQGLEAIPVRTRNLRWWGIGGTAVGALLLLFVGLQGREVLAAAPAMATPAIVRNGPGVQIDTAVATPVSGDEAPDSAYMDLKGFRTDLRALYVPWDPSLAAVQRRFTVNRAAFAADRAAERVEALVGAKALGRPVLKLYASDKGFQRATNEPAGRTWTVQNGEIAIAPSFLKGLVTKELVRALIYTELQAVSERAGTLDPVVMGRLEQELGELKPYRPDWQAMVGMRLPGLKELQGGSSASLRVGDKPYMTGAAFLVDFLGQQGSQALPTEGLSDLEGPFATFVYDRMADQSMLTVPAVRREIPEDLIQAFDAQAKAAGAPS